MRLRNGFVAVSLAVGLTAAGQAGAADWQEGAGILTAKSVVARTVTIDGREFHVTDRTTITGLEGERLTLEDLRVQDPWGGGLEYGWKAFVHRGHFELDRLTLQPAPH